MTFEIETPDPFNILGSTKAVMQKAKFVSLNQKAAGETAGKVSVYLEKSPDFPDHGHHLVGDFKTDTQLIFFESMMAFCFWSLPGRPKWGIELSSGEKVDGWYGVCAAFKKALEEGVPVADTDFFMKVTESEVRNLFRSATGAEIPLLKERVAILNENARILKERFGGNIINLIDKAEHDAVRLVELLVENFPSYRDAALYDGQEVVFFKIAHLLALDLEYRLTPLRQRPFLKNIDKLSVFADYKIPQLLRAFGIMEYKEPLAKMVDSYTIISAGSPEEVEIRAATIWSIELLRKLVPQYSTVQIGHVIWLMSQNQTLQSKIKPYHRTYSIFY